MGQRSHTSAPNTPRMSVPIIAGKVADTTATVNLTMDASVEGGIVVREDGGAYPAEPTAWTSYAAGEVIEEDLTGLAADTLHQAKLLYRMPGGAVSMSSSECSFRTQRAALSTFKFGIVADHHAHGSKRNGYTDRIELISITHQNMIDAGLDFFFDLGDSIHCENISWGSARTQHEAERRHREYRDLIGSLGMACPLFFVQGNHEGEQKWRTEHGDPTPDLALAARQKYIVNPNWSADFWQAGASVLPVGDFFKRTSESVYAWEWGDALFVVLDPYWRTGTKPHSNGTADDTSAYEEDGWNWTLGLGQYNLLYSILAASSKTWKFVFVHQLVGGRQVEGSITPYGRGGIQYVPYFEWGGKNLDDSEGFTAERVGWTYGSIHDMLVAAGVTAVFKGHDHFYAYEELDGLVYVTCPMPRDDTYGWGFKTQGGYTDEGSTYVQNSGHVEVTVTGTTSVKIDYIRAYLAGDGTNGETADTHTIS